MSATTEKKAEIVRVTSEEKCHQTEAQLRSVGTSWQKVLPRKGKDGKQSLATYRVVRHELRGFQWSEVVEQVNLEPA